jgi:CRISPR/Cas system-associated protein Cas10 (large subunit of type III CRISPR-Cas system)
MDRTIVSLDTDQIKKYVFATGTLKEIRGASAILEELNRKKMYDVIRCIDPDAALIFANGGSGMFEVSDETKGKLCIQAVEKLYREMTITASISGALMPCTPRNDFRNIFNTLAYRLRYVKDRKGLSLQPVTHSFLRPCDSCGEEYARYFDHEDMKKEENKEVICESCRRKRKKDRQIKEKIRRVLAGEEKIVETDETWDWLLQKLMETPDYDTKDKERPEEFENIGKLSTPPNYMGIIYADGNSMGKRLEALTSKEDVRKFSKIVDDAIRNAVLESVKTHLKPEGNCFPFDILMIGGDDLVMVTTAHKAIETGITVAKAFREYTGKEFAKCGLGSHLELSVGVAIAHAKFPLGSLLKLAESLLKFAKTEGAKQSRKKLSDSSEQGLINFQVINASSCLDFNPTTTLIP